MEPFIRSIESIRWRKTLIKKKGNLFDTTAVAIGHGVNCEGVMGAGIAKTFRQLFPENYARYKKLCERRLIIPGKTLVQEENGLVIFNIASQRAPGADATYKRVLQGLLAASIQAEQRDLDRIAIPLIGCGIGGLEWAGVEKIIEAVELAVPEVEYEVWKFE